MSDIVYPMRFLVIEAKAGSYVFYKSEVVYNSTGASIPLEPSNVLTKYGLSKSCYDQSVLTPEAIAKINASDAAKAAKQSYENENREKRNAQRREYARQRYAKKKLESVELENQE